MIQRTQSFDRIRLAVIVAGAAIAATALAQRQAATPPPPPAPPGAQPISGGQPNPYLVEIGTLKQQMAMLQSSVKALEAENKTMSFKLARTEELLARTYKSLKAHRHHLGLWFRTKTEFNASPPHQRVAVPIHPGMASADTGPPQMPDGGALQ